MTVIFQTVTKAVTTIAQFLAPFTMAIIVGAVTMALFIVIFAGSSASAERCSTDYVFSDGTTEGNAQAVWTYLKGKGLSDEAVSGVMGNMERESKF